MNPELPDTVRRYFEADAAQDREGMRAVLSPTVHVHDESHDYHGIDEVLAWKKSSSERYQYTSTPFASEQSVDSVSVQSRLEGNFPGSPVDVTYLFRLKDGLIEELKIG